MDAVLLLLALALPRAPLQVPAPAEAVVSRQDLGSIDFPNSGALEAQASFLRGVLLLHSFEYDDAREAFVEAQAIDPGFALAYWGEALTHSHPIWKELDVDQGRAALEQLAATREARAARAGTARERGLLDTVEVLFAPGDTPRRERQRAYAEALAALAAEHPGDLEVAAFRALAVLGTADTRDFRVYMRAASIAEEVYRRNPEHPGALHYLIHSYDDPVHAPLGLRMARTYARVAPAAAHALHMPSHIFVALGMWDESAASNVDSSRAADARRARKQLGVDERGFHSLYWLAYTYLQQGRLEAARGVLEDVQRDVLESEGSERTRYHLAVMRASYGINAALHDPRALAAAEAIEVDTAELDMATVAVDTYARGRAALYRGDVDGARQLLLELREHRKGSLSDAEAVAFGCCMVAPGTDTEESSRRRAVLVMERQLDGLIQLAGGDEAGLDALRAAAQDEDAQPYDFGPPLVVEPAHELLGRELLARGHAEEAAREAELALLRAPRRAASLLFLARARAATGEEPGARAAYRDLAAVWHRADPGLPLVDEVRRGAADSVPQEALPVDGPAGHASSPGGQ